MRIYFVHVILLNRLVSWRSVFSGRIGTPCVRYDSCDSKTFCTSQTTTTSSFWSPRVSSMPRYTHLHIVALFQEVKSSNNTVQTYSNYCWILTLFKPETKPMMDVLFWMLQLRFFDSFVERQPRLRRQRCIFTKERGRDGLFYLISCFFLISMVRHIKQKLFRGSSSRVASHKWLLRKELPQSCSDEYEFCHMGSPDDEHPTSLQLVHDIQLVPHRDPWPLCHQHPAFHCEGESNHNSTTKVGVN